MVTLKSFLGMIAAVPFIMACNQTGQVNATLFPASGSENVNPDTHLVLTFSVDSCPRRFRYDTGL